MSKKIQLNLSVDDDILAQINFLVFAGIKHKFLKKTNATRQDAIKLAINSSYDRMVKYDQEKEQQPKL